MDGTLDNVHHLTVNVPVEVTHQFTLGNFLALFYELEDEVGLFTICCPAYPTENLFHIDLDTLEHLPRPPEVSYRQL